MSRLIALFLIAFSILLNFPNPIFTDTTTSEPNPTVDMYLGDYPYSMPTLTIPYGSDNTIEINPNTYKFLMINGSLVNGDYIQTTSDGWTMVPLRIISEQLGANVNWNASTQEIDINNNQISIILYPGKDNASVNNNTVSLSTPAYIDNGTTYVPLRFIAENLNCNVGYYNPYDSSYKSYIYPLVWVDSTDFDKKT